MEQNVVLEMRDISKNFTGVRALSHVDFTLRKGEIHALMGENGAGKSTLIKVLTGVHEFESGTIHMAGNSNAIINHSPQEAHTKRALLGSAIRERREAQSLSQAEARPHGGSSKSHIWRIESGRVSVGLDDLGRIADALDVRVRDLFFSNAGQHAERERTQGDAREYAKLRPRRRCRRRSRTMRAGCALRGGTLPYPSSFLPR